MRHNDDILWKVVLEEVFDDFLRFIYPDAESVYDLERGFEFLDKELAEMYPEPEKEKDTRFADKLVKVYHRDGGEEWVLLHIEIQGDTSKWREFPERMFRYFYRILDRHRRPVSAVAVFTGLHGKMMPDHYRYTQRDTQLLYQYRTISILDYKDEELEKSDNPFAQVVLASKVALFEGRIPESELLDQKVFIASRLLRRGFSKRKVQAIFTFLEGCILFEDPKMNRTFRERIQSQDKDNIMGIEEYLKSVGREEGIALGDEKRSRQVVEQLLREGTYSNEKIADLVGVTVDFVQKVKASLNGK
jgi:hypothetical protein